MTLARQADWSSLIYPCGHPEHPVQPHTFPVSALCATQKALYFLRRVNFGSCRRFRVELRPQVRGIRRGDRPEVSIFVDSRHRYRTTQVEPAALDIEEQRNERQGTPVLPPELWPLPLPNHISYQ
jgi:hypothetical protein